MIWKFDFLAKNLSPEYTPPMPDGYDGPLADGISIETLYNESQDQLAGRPTGSAGRAFLEPFEQLFPGLAGCTSFLGS